MCPQQTHLSAKSFPSRPFSELVLFWATASLSYLSVSRFFLLLGCGFAACARELPLPQPETIHRATPTRRLENNSCSAGKHASRAKSQNTHRKVVTHMQTYLRRCLSQIAWQDLWETSAQNPCTGSLWKVSTRLLKDISVHSREPL